MAPSTPAMPRPRRVRTADRLRLATAAALLLLAPVSQAMAQSHDTGAIIVTVRTPDGLPAPGAAVTLVGPQATATATTDAAGRARFAAVIPGTYSVELSAAGFQAARLAGVLASTGRTTGVNFEIEVAGVEEIIVVEGARSLLDPTALHVGATIDSELIERTPSGSGLWNSVLDKVPGVVLSGVDVGGGNATQQQNFTAHGSLLGQNQIRLNGSPTTDPANGAAQGFFAVPAFAEVEVSTAALDVEASTPGVIVNMVSKSGTNRLQGGFRYYYSNESLAGNNVTEELLDEGLGEGNPNTLLSDLDLQLGGPIVRDRVWGFVDYNRFRESRLIIGLPETDQDERRLTNITANVDWQVADDHRLAGRYFFSDKFRLNLGAGPLTPPSSAALQDPSDLHIGQVNWVAAWSPRTFSDLRVSFRDAALGFVARSPGSAAPHPEFPVGIPPTYDFVTGEWSGSPGESMRWTREYSASTNIRHSIAGANTWHDLKFGGEWRRSRDWSRSSDINATVQFVANGVAEGVWLETAPGVPASRMPRPDGSGDTTLLSLYLQDSAQFGRRLNVNAGLRFDHARTGFSAGSTPDSFWAGIIPDDEFGAQFRATSFAASEVLTWNTLAPRFSVAYDLSGRGRTLLKAGYGQYTLRPNGSIRSGLGPTSSGINEYFWDDLNGDGVFQWDERGAFLGGSHARANTAIDPDIAPTRLHEMTLGLEYQTGFDLVLGATAIYRTASNIIVDIDVGVPYGPVAARLGVPDSYTPVETVDPGPDGIPGTADDGGTITVWSQDPDTFGNNSRLVTNAARWGLDAGYDYRGLEFTAQKRFSDRWQALASWTIGRIDSGVGGGFGAAIASTSEFINPNRDINKVGRTSEDRSHIVKVNGSYLFPDPIGVNLGISLRHESGIPVRRQFLVPRGVVNQGRPLIVAAPWGEDDNPASLGGRMSSITILDLRAEKQLGLPGRWGRLNFSIDAFNILNENAERRVVDRAGRAYGRVLSIVPPRLVRLGVGWTF